MRASARRAPGALLADRTLLERSPARAWHVVTDLSMPGMTGLKPAREVLALRPVIPVLIASGDIPPEERAEAEAIGVRGVVPMPRPIARMHEVPEDRRADREDPRGTVDRPPDPRTARTRP